MSEPATRTVDGLSAPGAGWASGPLGAVQAADREIAHQTALRARAVAEFAAAHPASADRQPGQPGAMSAERRVARPQVLADVSEWVTQEMVVALCISSQAAEQLLVRSLTLVHRLPRTLEALERGELHSGHLWPMLEKVAPIADPKKRAAVEQELLEWMAGRVTTPAQLGAKARRLGLARDARDEAARLAAALRERGVGVRADRREGMAVFDALLTIPEAQALLDALGRYADALDDPDDHRTRGQKMADCLLDLVLRPGENGLRPVQAQLTVVAGVRALLGGDQPGEIGSDPVSAEMVRALAVALGLLPAADADTDRDADPFDPPAPSPGPVDEWSTDTWPEAWRAADERWWAEVEARALRGEWGGEDDPPDDVLARWWDQGPPADADVADARGDTNSDDGPHRDPDSAHDADADAAPLPEPAGWTAARRALEAASAGVAQLHRTLSHARRSVADAQRADEDDEATWQRSPAGRVTTAPTDLDALLAASRSQREALAALLDASAGGTLLDRPRIAVVDELTGALLALTDSTDLRRRAIAGLGLGPPGPTAGYRPGRALDRFVRARDRRCRFPGCRRRVPLGGELDHDRPYPDGPTSAENLTGYCTGHHRGKHQAPGWRHELAAGGTLTVTTPSGLVASTAPPPF
ncbi:HNH endonuclease signature motif containing protein [Blastococcus sp. LR1]|uniref:HNH endonuclease signature motif containing protein n=1 Tax=Blastococcus sp. LR1 TaxID=2877000 RepID=UPI001CCD34CC|nr:HNH endonuclease signature motif containing protein [Blastococcus sp. LR1]MCA0146464.1 HNH endonuclease [Blastococcus sp. LR1]